MPSPFLQTPPSLCANSFCWHSSSCGLSWLLAYSLIFALSDPRELSFTNLAKQTLLPLLMIALMLAVGLMCLLQLYLYLYYRCLTVTIASSDTNWWWHLLLIMWFQKFSLLCSVSNWKAEVWDSFFILIHRMMWNYLLSLSRSIFPHIPSQVTSIHHCIVK